MSPLHTKTYIFTFLATIALFVCAFVASSYFTKLKTEDLKTAEDRIAINILSLETQYDLLNDASCKEFNKDSLRAELDTLADKLSFIESQVGETNPEVFRLKRYYTLLQIKDYLLTKRMSEQCGFKTVFILYFYAAKDCPECQTQELMLKAIKNTYPQIEIYSFDHKLDLSAVQTLITLHNISPVPPVIDINGKTYPPFETLEAFTRTLDTIIAAQATSTATTTKNKRAQ